MLARFVPVVALVLAVSFAVPAAAQWESDLVLYLWAAGLDGRLGARDLEADVDVSFSDILEDLEFGAMGAYAATKGRWLVGADLVITNIGVTERGEAGVVRLDVDSDMTIAEGDLGYAVGEGFQIFGGARWVDISNDLDLRVGEQSLHADGGESWVDPLVGVRAGTGAGERWAFWVRADVGGFGVGSDLSWNAVAAFSWRVSDRINIGAGYRLLDIDYEHGSGADYFLFDARMDGPVTGITFSF
jgi:hypothetical protein